MTRVLRESAADPSLLSGETIGVIGFGNQGSAQALCLRDAGLDVRVLTRPRSPSRERARAEGFAPASPESLAECAVVAVMVSDEAQREVLQSFVRPHARKGALVVFAHGFALREGAPVRDDLDAVLVGPLGPGSLLRERFLSARGLPGLFAIVRDATGGAGPKGLAYASALRMTRAGLLPTTLEEEVVTDLFSEQVVLVGGVVELMRSAWEVLVESGVSEEVAYYSCVQELKQILDLVHRAGPAGMRKMISSTAQYGGLTRGRRVVGEHARAAMRDILGEIKTGEFAREWAEENRAGAHRLEGLRLKEAQHPMEDAGERVRTELGEVDRPPTEP